MLLVKAIDLHEKIVAALAAQRESRRVFVRLQLLVRVGLALDALSV